MSTIKFPSQMAEDLDVSPTVTLSGGTGTYSLGGNLNTITNGGFTFSNTLSNVSGPYTVTAAATGITHPWNSGPVSPKIKLDGEGADIEVNGWSLMNAIQKIEERLNILHPNTKLETEWEELKVLGDQYRKLEQHIKDKQATWDKLKAMPPPIVD